jgi:CHAT domain-containing protein
LTEKVTPPEKGKLIVLANPDFGTSTAAALGTPVTGKSLAALFRGVDFQPLPGAEAEGRWLREQAADLGFKNAALFLGKQATKVELRQVHSPDVLHLATHGFILPAQAATTSPESAKTACAPRETNLTSPMLRSGLALAGAESTLKALARGQMVAPDNDGIVTAEEICCLDLHGTRLVVLSACDTGEGEALTGEGVLGLRRGFAEAGAQNLLLTLWPVQDGATSRLMMDFYTALSRERNTAEALAHTQGNWLKKLREDKGPAEACRIAGPFVLSSRGGI